MFLISTWLGPLRRIYLLIALTVLLRISILRLCFIIIAAYFLGVSNKIWIRLNFFALSWTSSTLILVIIVLNPTITCTISTGCLINLRLFWFRLTSLVILIDWMILGRLSSLSIILNWFIILVLHHKFFLANKLRFIICIFDGCWSFSIRRGVWNHHYLFRASFIFFIFSSLLMKTKLLSLT